MVMKMKIIDFLKNMNLGIQVAVFDEENSGILYADSGYKMFWLQKYEELRKSEIKKFYISKVSLKIWI